MSDPVWIRPAGPKEETCVKIYNDTGCLVISYVMRISSSRSITSQETESVFTSLHRKTGNLRTIFKMKGAELWLCNMRQEYIDFEVIEDADVNQVFHDMVRHHFNPEGPLWAAKFLPWNKKQSEYIGSTNIEKPDGALDLPYISHVVIAFHHAITDGHSCLRIVRAILELFDDVIEGNAIDDKEQFCSLLDRKDENRIMGEIEKGFLTNKNIFEERNAIYSECLVDPLIHKAFHVPMKNIQTIKCLPYVLDKETTEEFSARCKAEGVTFHTGFISILEAAFVKLLSEGNFLTDSYKISSQHSVNLRRYYNNCENAFGNGLGLMNMMTDTPINVLDDFWTHAKKVHSIFKSEQDRNSAIENTVLEKLSGTSPFRCIDMAAELRPDHIPKMFTYNTTNMLDVTKVIGNNRKHIRMDYYDRLVGTQCMLSLWSSVFQTFNGRLMHSLQYSFHLMDTPVAQKLSDNIFQTLRRVIE